MVNFDRHHFRLKNKIRSKESETEQKHNAVLQELEDDYEKRLADKARQLEDKVRIQYI